jgi:TRAP-type C4-dicarboxylate transport system permease small subunit
MTPSRSRAIRVLDAGLDLLLCVVLAAMAGLVFVNVFCRFVLQFSLSWADELAMVLLVWLTFLGAGAAMRDRMHYAFDYLVRALPPRGRRAVKAGGHLLGLAMTLLLFYWSGRVVFLITDWVMPATGMPRSWVYAACPVGCVFLLFYQARNLIADWRAPEERAATADGAVETAPRGD